MFTTPHKLLLLRYMSDRRGLPEDVVTYLCHFIFTPVDAVREITRTRHDHVSNTILAAMSRRNGFGIGQEDMDEHWIFGFCPTGHPSLMPSAPQLQAINCRYCGNYQALSVPILGDVPVSCLCRCVASDRVGSTPFMM
jgi:hypothetical protein